MNCELYTYEINGYLRSLQRLSKVACDFNAVYIPLNGQALEEAISKFLERYDDITSTNLVSGISFGSVERILDNLIFNNLSIGEEGTIKMLRWDLVEYFGLASTAQSDDNDFNPLINGKVVQVDIDSSFYSWNVFIGVDYEDAAICLNLGLKKSKGSESLIPKP